MFRTATMAVLVFAACSSAPNDSHCVAPGAYDFFLVRPGDFATLGGSFDVAEKSGTLQVSGEPTRECQVVSESAVRPPGVVCSVSWQCLALACPDCARWQLGIVLIPTDDGVLPEGSLSAVIPREQPPPDSGPWTPSDAGNSFDGGLGGGVVEAIWSAARRTP